MVKKSHLREIEETLYQLSHKSAEMLQLISEGFNLHSKKHLLEAENIAKEVHESEKVLTDALLKELESHKEELDKIKELIPVPGHLERLGDNCESIISATRTKIRDGMLFSDRAVSEINFLFKSLVELIKGVGDIILTKNILLSKHIVVESDKINDKASDYATLHEERLVLGICNPKTSSLFLDILDSLKGVSFHLKKIAQTILSSNSDRSDLLS